MKFLAAALLRVLSARRCFWLLSLSEFCAFFPNDGAAAFNPRLSAAAAVAV